MNFSRVKFSFSGLSTKMFHCGSSRKFIVHEDKMDEYGRALCVRGYHVYREIWEAAVVRSVFLLGGGFLDLLVCLSDCLH